MLAPTLPRNLNVIITSRPRLMWPALGNRTTSPTTTTQLSEVNKLLPSSEQLLVEKGSNFFGELESLIEGKLLFAQNCAAKCLPFSGKYARCTSLSKSKSDRIGEESFIGTAFRYDHYTQMEEAFLNGASAWSFEAPEFRLRICHHCALPTLTVGNSSSKVRILKLYAIELIQKMKTICLECIPIISKNFKNLRQKWRRFSIFSGENFLCDITHYMS